MTKKIALYITADSFPNLRKIKDYKFNFYDVEEEDFSVLSKEFAFIYLDFNTQDPEHKYLMRELKNIKTPIFINEQLQDEIDQIEQSFFVVWPGDSAEDFIEEVSKQLKQLRYIEYFKTPKSCVYNSHLLGVSEHVAEIDSFIERAARTSLPCLIEGENGSQTHKIAVEIHLQSTRKENQIIFVDCEKNTDPVLKKLLFGKKSSMLSSKEVNDAVGLFVFLSEGTLVLNNCEYLSLDLQSMIYKAVHEKIVCAIGDNRPIKVLTKTIFISRISVKKLIRRRSFREDLYRNLAYYQFEILPLRDRREDIIPILAFYNDKISHRLSCKAFAFPKNILELIEKEDWKNNIEEIKQFLQNLYSNHKNKKLTMKEMPFSNDERIFGPIVPLKDLTAEYVKYALEIFKGNKSKASRYLDIDRKTLRKKICHIESIGEYDDYDDDYDGIE